MKFAISAIPNLNDGMSVHHMTLVEVLSSLGDVTLVPDDTCMTEADLEQFDYIVRYGWPSGTSSGYGDADFRTNIAKDSKKNILVAPFNMMMLHPVGVKQVEERFDRVIYDSSFSKEHGDRVIAGKKSTYIHPVPRGVVNGPHRKRSLGPDSPYTFLHISNGLYWIKGVDLIVDAFLKSFTKDDAVALTLVLKDQLGTFNRISRRFKRAGRLKQLKLLEKELPQARMAEIYGGADCYVCASRYDTFSLPTLEAATFGLRVIAHDKGGMRDYLAHLNLGQLIPLKTRRVVIPANTWKGNSRVDGWEPTSESILRALLTAYTDGRQHTVIHSRLKTTFCDMEVGAERVLGILS
jgi:glycosyltransferase involved in cell wall biosynthesis